MSPFGPTPKIQMSSLVMYTSSLSPYSAAQMLVCVPDMLGMNAGGQGAALGFQFYGGPIVTMLASKTSRKYEY